MAYIFTIYILIVLAISVQFSCSKCNDITAFSIKTHRDNKSAHASVISSVLRMTCLYDKEHCVDMAFGKTHKINCYSTRHVSEDVSKRWTGRAVVVERDLVTGRKPVLHHAHVPSSPPADRNVSAPTIRFMFINLPIGVHLNNR